MKHLKILGLLAVVAVMAGFSTSAWATVVTAPAGTIYTGAFNASSEGKVVLVGSNGVKTECVKNFGGTVVADGTSVTVRSSISNMSFSNCNNGNEIHVKENGTMEFHSTGGGSGTVTLSGSKIEKTAGSIFGTITCIYTTNSTSLGTFTGSKSTGGKARLDISATIPRTGGSALCGTSGTLTGTLVFNSPSYFDID